MEKSISFTFEDPGKCHCKFTFNNYLWPNAVRIGIWYKYTGSDCIHKSDAIYQSHDTKVFQLNDLDDIIKYTISSEAFNYLQKIIDMKAFW